MKIASLSHLLFAAALLGTGSAQNRVCIAPDNGDGTIDWPAQCPYGNAFAPIEVGTSNGELVALEIRIPPMLMTCRPGTNPPQYDSGIDSPQAVAIPASIRYVKQSKAADVPVDLRLSVRNTPRSAPGADVQVFDTEILSMALELQGIGDAEWGIFSCVALPGSSGKTTITRLPSGSFNVDSFFDIAYRITIEGAEGGSFGGDVIDTTAEVRLSQSSYRFQGVSYNPIEGATVTPEGAKLKISNLGSSGCDGVSFLTLPGIENACYGLQVKASSASPTGKLLEEGETMSMYPFPPPPTDFPDLPNLPASMALSNTGGTVSAVCSSGGMGASEWVVEVYHGRTLRAVSVVADGAVGYSVDDDWFVADSFSFGVEREMKESGEKGGTADINIGIGELQRTSLVCEAGAPGLVTVPGTPPVTGDRVVCSPRDPQVLPRVVTSLEMRSSAVAGFYIDDIIIGLRGLQVRGLDEAAISCSSSRLRVSNLGSSGCDGVSIDLGEGPIAERLPLRVELAPIDVHGTAGSFFTSAHDEGGLPLIEAEYRGGGGGAGGAIRVAAPPSMRVCRVTVRNAGATVGEFDVPLVAGAQTPVCSVGDGPGGAPLLTGCGKRSIGWPWDLSCLVQEFDRPVAIAPPGGPPAGTGPLVGDEVLLLLPDATPAEVEALRTVQLRASGIPSFEVCGAGQGSSPPAPVLTAEDHSSFDYPGEGSRMVDSVPKYLPTDTGETICIFSSLSDLVEIADNGGLKEYSATLRLDMEGVNGFGFARSVFLPGTFTIEHGPNPFGGQDVQAFSTQVRNFLFSLPPGDPDFAQLRVSGGGDLGFDSPGDVIITKIPECVFVYDEIQKILASLTIVGTPGGGLSGGSILDASLEQNLHVTNPAVLFGGAAHVATGAADVEVGAGGRLRVSNLGSSGCDGVSIDLGGTQAFGVAFDPLDPPEFADGGTLRFEEFGRVRGSVVGSSLGDCVITEVYDGGGNPLIYNVSVDFSSVAPDGITLQALDRGVVVAQVQVAATAASYSLGAGSTGLPPIKGLGKLAGLSAVPCKYIRWCDRGLFSAQGVAPVGCDEVRMLAHGVPYESISRFELRVSGEADHCIVIEEELHGYFGRDFVFGNATRVSAGLPGGAIPGFAVGGIDSSGFGDGAGSISFVGPCDAAEECSRNDITLSLDSLEMGSKDATLVVEERGTRGGVSGASLGSVRLQNTGAGEVELSSDFSVLGASQVRLKLYDTSGRVSENPLYCGRLVHNAVQADGAPVCYLKYKLNRAWIKSWSTSGDADDRPTEEVSFYYNKIAFTMNERVEVRLVDGSPPVFADRIELSVVDPTSPGSGRASSRLSCSNMKGFQITGVSNGPDFGHGLPAQSVGSGEISADEFGRIRVSNIGSSGQDGVAVDIGEAEGVWQTWEPVDLAAGGGSMTLMSSKRRLSESMEQRVKTRSPRSSLRVDHEPFVFYDILLMADPGGDGSGSGVEVATKVVCLDSNGDVTGSYPVSALAGEELSVGSMQPVDPTGSGRIVGSGYLPATVVAGEGYLGRRLCVEFEQPMRFAPGGGGAECICTHLIIACCDDDCDGEVDDICGSSVLCSTFSGVSHATQSSSFLYLSGGRVVSSIGSARLDACRATTVLPVTNLGSEGQDGVRLGRPAGTFDTEIVSMDLRGGLPLSPGLPVGAVARTIVLDADGELDGNPNSLGSLMIPLGTTYPYIDWDVDFAALFGGLKSGEVRVIVSGKNAPAPGGGEFEVAGAVGTALYCYPGGASIVRVGRLDERESPDGQLGSGYCIEFDSEVEITPPGGLPGSGFIGDRVEVRGHRRSDLWDTEMVSLSLRGSDPGGGSPDVSFIKIDDIEGESRAGATVFGTWLVDNFTPAEIDLLDASGYCLDIDGDGFCEVEEFILGLDPRVRDSPAHGPLLTSAARMAPSGELEKYLRVTYEYDPTLEGTTYEPGVSTDLADYDFEFVARLMEEESLPDGRRRVTYELPEPLSAAQRKFVKFKAGADLAKKVN